jgi:glutathione S-transferase
MKLYDAAPPAPHPRRVRMFLAEKGLDIPREIVSMADRAHKLPQIRSKNALGQLPILELDDGDVICETLAICRYLEALNPEPALFGITAREVAKIDMWSRRVEFQLQAPLSQVWLHTHPMTEFHMREQGMTRFPQMGEEGRRHYLSKLAWIDGEMGGREFLAGERFSMADIVALSVLDFGRFVGLDIPPDLPNLSAWHARVSSRPSAMM